MLAAYRRMSASILTHLGEDALLRGDTPCRVNVERNVEVVGEDMQTVALKTVITLEHVDAITGVALLPEQGDSVTVFSDDDPDAREHYQLDRKLEDNGVNQRFVAVIL